MQQIAATNERADEDRLEAKADRLQAKADRLQADAASLQAAEDKQNLQRQIDVLNERFEKERMLVFAGDIVTVVYNKMYEYAKSIGLNAAKVSMGKFLEGSNPNSINAQYFNASLQFIGISLHDFNLVRVTKQTRNNLYHSDVLPTQLMLELHAADIPELRQFVEVVYRYPVAFDVDIGTNEITGTEVDDRR